VPIADNFDTDAWIEPATAPATSSDEVGAFRFSCLGGHLAKNDPIVYPGQAGASHLHQFFGNTSTDEKSNYESLRTTGGSTCTRSTSQSVQRSAYWMPAMLDGAGNAVKADWMNTYYKQLPANNPACGAAPDATHVGYCIPMPNGLRFILGYNMATMKGGPTDSGSSDYWAMGFDCVKTDGSGESYTGIKRTMAEIVTTGQCPTGAWLRVYLTFPDCWDGKNLDSADHRSHVAYASYGDWGYPRCDTAHPYVIPTFTMNISYTIVSTDDTTLWHYSSDEMMPGTAPGTTFHGDWFGAWDPTVMAMWMDNCINKDLNCSAGNLGNGYGMKTYSGFTTTANPRLVPIP
jgi:hypothetical protein